ncbi:hypothetical protein JG687_00018879 [Phytophthora cactorum]|uniref:Uncharacterized protein n=1 Tax=Phytophthora cactorum TaxID=29920 RepID=A0A8T1TK23_9STRA|nr:hypothetical protein GQ600_21801 [Phytophthora cactorum]KAG6942762.1 hypothetical protein JG687_00018879 [Phytophthora cactorum]
MADRVVNTVNTRYSELGLVESTNMSVEYQRNCRGRYQFDLRCKRVATRELSDPDPEEERRGGVKAGMEQQVTQFAIRSTEHTPPLTRNHKKTKCNRFTNWWKRLFNKNAKKCNKDDAR